MNVLVFTSVAGHPSELPILGDDQVVCGPFQVNRSFENHLYSLRSPNGNFDAGTMASRIPQAQKPDVVCVQLDAATSAFPRNLAGVASVRVALVGDVFSQAGGCTRVFEYLAAEQFDHVVLVESKLDLPLVAAATTAGVHWYPGLWSCVPSEVLKWVRGRKRLPRVAVPSVEWARHAPRNQFVRSLNERGVKSVALRRDVTESLEILGHSRVLAATSNHGELRTELFLALASGTPVLGNAVFSASGFANVLQGTGALEVFDSCGRLAERAAALVHQEVEDSTVSKIQGWYDTYLSPGARINAVRQLVCGGAPFPMFEISRAAVVSVPFASLKPTLEYAAAVQACVENSAEPIAYVDTKAPLAARLLLSRFPRLLQVSPAENTQGGTLSLYVSSDLPSVPSACSQAECVWVPGGLTTPPPGYVRSAELPDLAYHTAYRTQQVDVAAMRAALEAADFETAEKMANELIKKAPRTPEGYVVAADLAAERRDDAALSRLSGILATLDPHEPRLIYIAERMSAGLSDVFYRQVNATWQKIRASRLEDAEKYVEFILSRTGPAPSDAIVEISRLGAWLKEGRGAIADACHHWKEAALHNPNDAASWFDVGLRLWELGDQAMAYEAFRRAAEQRSDVVTFATAFDRVRQLSPQLQAPSQERDLLITGAESNMKHGAGVLLARFFSESLNIVTLRMSTCFRGVELVGSSNLLSASLPESEVEVEDRLRRLLAPFTIRRIVCVPFDRTEFIHAIAAHAVTKAALCAYIMDDRNVYTSSVEDDLLVRLFQASRLRLTISPEMQLTYAFKFHQTFELLPPVVSSSTSARVNRWSPKKRGANHCAFVGSLWSQAQFDQLARLFARTGLKADWFGKEAKPECEKVGIFGQGFIPETELADRLTTYPFVVVPSGELEGAEDNEWLTRLSLPSRLVFLLQCGIPILVVGSQDTCAGRFVTSLNLGRVMSSKHPNPLRVVQELTSPATRETILRSIKAAAPAFIMPQADKWIWNSLDKGEALPAPFHSHMPAQPCLKVLWQAA